MMGDTLIVISLLLVLNYLVKSSAQGIDINGDLLRRTSGPCGLDISKRSCSPRNDVFWTARWFDKKELNNERLCRKPVILVNVGRKVTTSLGTFFKASFTSIVNGTRERKVTKKHIPFDEHRQRCSLRGKWFVIFSKVKMLKATRDVFLRRKDLVLEGPGRKYLLNKVNELLEICNLLRTLKQTIRNAYESGGNESS